MILPDSKIVDDMIPRLVDRLIDEGLASADYVVQILMCLGDPLRRSFIEAAVSGDERQLDVIAVELAKLNDNVVSISRD